MNRADIERHLEEAGWKVDGGFDTHMIIGHDDRASIMVHRGTGDADDPAFELYHDQMEVTYWIREIPTPDRALELLEEHGSPPEDELGIPTNAQTETGE